MFKHGPCVLDGPVSRDPEKWKSLADGAPIRRDLVERIRREIAEGTYDTPEKWESALDRLFKRLTED